MLLDNIENSLDKYNLFNVIINHILENKKYFLGNYKWITKSGAGYEKELCNLLNWNFVNKRHWDCEFDNYKIELKKSKSNGIQVDEIRYAEELLLDNYECNENIITIFIEVYNDNSKKKGIKNIYLARSKDVIKLLNFPNKEYCQMLIERNNKNKGLSFTHRLKYNNIRTIGICIPFD